MELPVSLSIGSYDTPHYQEELINKNVPIAKTFDFSASDF